MRFYISQQTKEELEAEIAKLKKEIKFLTAKDAYENIGKLSVYEQILSNSIVLPVEKSWNHFYGIVDGIDTKSFYPNGVIIQKN